MRKKGSTRLDAVWGWRKIQAEDVSIWWEEMGKSGKSGGRGRSWNGQSVATSCSIRYGVDLAFRNSSIDLQTKPCEFAVCQVHTYSYLCVRKRGHRPRLFRLQQEWYVGTE